MTNLMTCIFCGKDHLQSSMINNDTCAECHQDGNKMTKNYECEICEDTGKVLQSNGPDDVDEVMCECQLGKVEEGEITEERRKGNVDEQKARLANSDGIKACVRQVVNYFKVVYFVDNADHTVKDSTGNIKLFKTFDGAKKWCEEKYFFIFD